MPATLRTPNADARGNSLAGQFVGWNLSTGDTFTVHGQSYRVLNTWTHGAQCASATESKAETFLFTYRELAEWGARFTETEQANALPRTSPCSDSFPATPEFPNGVRRK